MKTKLSNSLYLHTTTNDEGGYTSRLTDATDRLTAGVIIHTTKRQSYYKNVQEQHTDALRAYV
jgi:hypothetical protein